MFVRVQFNWSRVNSAQRWFNTETKCVESNTSDLALSGSCCVCLRWGSQCHSGSDAYFFFLVRDNNSSIESKAKSHGLVFFFFFFSAPFTIPEALLSWIIKHFDTTDYLGPYIPLLEQNKSLNPSADMAVQCISFFHNMLIAASGYPDSSGQRQITRKCVCWGGLSAMCVCVCVCGWRCQKCSSRVRLDELILMPEPCRIILERSQGENTLLQR